jgi:dTDP-4-dehydrorhamnose 3,5-epimerase
MIHDVRVKKLRVIKDDRGRLMEILRSDDELFEEFGQVYMTTAYPGVLKAWHYHELQDDNFTCIKGIMMLGLYDGRKGSPTQGQTDKFVISLDDPMLVHIPRGVYHGFRCVGDEEAIVVNTVTRPYDRVNPDEYREDPFNEAIPFDWGGGITVWG